MDDNELLEKVVRTTEIGAANGGLLNADQANRFIDYMFDATVLGRQVRKVRMRSNDMDIDKVNVGKKIARLATEAVDDGVNAGATFTKVSLTTKKIRLDWELSEEGLEDNIEGDALEDHIARLMATQFGNDLEDLAINGDTALTGDALYKAFNGYRKLAVTSGHVVDAAGAPIGRALFNKALKAMPRNYLQRRNQLKFFTGSNLIQDYLYSLTDLATTPEDIASSMIRTGPNQVEGPAGFVTGYAFGVPISEVPLFKEDMDGDYASPTGDHGDLWLTFPNNLLWGVKREVVVHREFKPKKDTIEYTAYVRFGVQIENADAFVVVKNAKLAA
jgi:hypothetical protein